MTVFYIDERLNDAKKYYIILFIREYSIMLDS